MKRLGLFVTLLLVATLLSACGGKGGDGAAQGASAPQATARAQAETAAEATPNAAPSAAQGVEIAAPVAAGAEVAAGERPIDLDLSKLSGTVVYSQVYDMLAEPEAYMGQKIRVKGGFSVYEDEITKQKYFAVVIADATACCAQGMEFDWKGEHEYPRDYPPLDTVITVTGTFGTYYEGENMYVQLADATVYWNE